MQIGGKIKELRKAQNLSPGGIEKKTGLLRCYTSRVENGYTTPGVEMLEKYAHALGIPLYTFFTNGESVETPKLPRSNDGSLWGDGGKPGRELRAFAKALSRMDDRNQKLIMTLARKMASRP